jgi:hypothetical protein
MKFRFATALFALAMPFVNSHVDGDNHWAQTLIRQSNHDFRLFGGKFTYRRQAGEARNIHVQQE